jgi:hypothetical protein
LAYSAVFKHATILGKDSLSQELVEVSVKDEKSLKIRKLLRKVLS